MNYYIHQYDNIINQATGSIFRKLDFRIMYALIGTYQHSTIDVWGSYRNHF